MRFMSKTWLTEWVCAHRYPNAIHWYMRQACMLSRPWLITPESEARPAYVKQGLSGWQWRHGCPDVQMLNKTFIKDITEMLAWWCVDLQSWQVNASLTGASCFSRRFYFLWILPHVEVHNFRLFRHCSIFCQIKAYYLLLWSEPEHLAVTHCLPLP